MIKVDGVSKLQRYLLTLAPKAKAELRQITVNTAVAMRDEARARVEVDSGELRDSNRFELSNGGLSFTLIADAPHWAYVEFGTGGLVEIPTGFESLAAQYRGKGIREVNLPARPFLIPAYLLHKDLYLQAVKRALPRILR